MLTTCAQCGSVLNADARFCPQCGHPQPRRPSLTPQTTPAAITEEMNGQVLSVMVGMLILAVLFPPWETPSDQPPAFLGFHPLWSSQPENGVVSRMLLIIEASTIAIAGVYLSWILRKKR